MMKTDILCSVGPDLGPNCLEKFISRPQKSLLAWKELTLRPKIYLFGKRKESKNLVCHISSRKNKAKSGHFSFSQHT